MIIKGIAYVFLVGQRKNFHHDILPGWKEEAWERGNYIECAIFSKPEHDLSDVDRRWIGTYGEIPVDEWFMPDGWRIPDRTDDASQTD